MEENHEAFAAQVWEDFFPRLARLAKRKLGSLPKRDFDEEDVALSALNSFFKGVKEGRLEVGSHDELWKILAVIAARKVVKQKRKAFSQKRGSGRIRGESVFQHDDNEVGFDFVLDENQMPEFEDLILNSCDEMLSLLKNEKTKRTAILRMQGFSIAEISSNLDCSVARTKQRLANIREIWGNQ